MKTEEVKYVYQDGGNLLVPEKNTSGVYQETTVRPLNTGSKGKEGNNRKCWFSKVQIILPIVALVLCVIVIIVNIEIFIIVLGVAKQSLSGSLGNWYFKRQGVGSRCGNSEP